MPRLTDPLFAPPPKLPFAAGASPFRQKGAAYLGDIEFLEKSVPGGYAAVLAAVADPAQRAFLGQRFRASEWYDVLPNPGMQATAAKLRGVAISEHLRGVGRFHADSALNGLYRALLKFVSNENVALWMPRVSGIYHEFGRCETRVLSPKVVAGVRHGVPRMLVGWLATVSSSFCERTLEVAGSRAPRVTFGEVHADGAKVGYDLHRLEFELTWL